MADEPITQIPSIPAGAPKEIVSWMGAVRSRLLAIKDQFTSTEVTKLKALLSAKPAAAPVVAASTLAITFLPAPYEFYNGTGDSSWKPISVVDAGVPDGAKAVVIQALWRVLSNVGSDEHWALLRVDSSKGNGDPLADTFVLAAGLVGNSAHGVAQQTMGVNQGTYPVIDGKFEYTSARYGLGWSNISLKIVGYLAE